MRLGAPRRAVRRELEFEREPIAHLAEQRQVIDEAARGLSERRKQVGIIEAHGREEPVARRPWIHHTV
jgi:hypothetical protein